MHSSSKIREKTTMIYLLGVKYLYKIKNVGIAKIIVQPGIHSTYKIELNKAVKTRKICNPK